MKRHQPITRLLTALLALGSGTGISHASLGTHSLSGKFVEGNLVKELHDHVDVPSKLEQGAQVDQIKVALNKLIPEINTKIQNIPTKQELFGNGAAAHNATVVQNWYHTNSLGYKVTAEVDPATMLANQNPVKYMTDWITDNLKYGTYPDQGDNYTNFQNAKKAEFTTLVNDLKARVQAVANGTGTLPGVAMITSPAGTITINNKQCAVTQGSDGVWSVYKTEESDYPTEGVIGVAGDEVEIPHKPQGNATVIKKGSTQVNAEGLLDGERSFVDCLGYLRGPTGKYLQISKDNNGNVLSENGKITMVEKDKASEGSRFTSEAILYSMFGHIQPAAMVASYNALENKWIYEDYCIEKNGLHLVPLGESDITLCNTKGEYVDLQGKKVNEPVKLQGITGSVWASSQEDLLDQMMISSLGSKTADALAKEIRNAGDTLRNRLFYVVGKGEKTNGKYTAFALKHYASGKFVGKKEVVNKQVNNLSIANLDLVDSIEDAKEYKPGEGSLLLGAEGWSAETFEKGMKSGWWLRVTSNPRRGWMIGGSLGVMGLMGAGVGGYFILRNSDGATNSGMKPKVKPNPNIKVPSTKQTNTSTPAW